MRTIRDYFLNNVCRAPEGEGGGGAGGAGGGEGGAGGGEGGGAQAAWYEHKDLGLDDDVKTFIAGKKTPDLKTGLKSWMDADKHARDRNVIEKPDPKKLSEWKGWTELGWVADPAKYELKAPDEKAIKFKYDGELWGEFKKLAHEHRIPLGAAQTVHDKMIEFWGKRYDATEAKGAGDLAATQAALDEAWGADKARNLELAKRAARTFGVGIEDMAELERVTGSPRLLKMFHAIGSKLGEANLIGADSGGGGGPPDSVATLRAELNRLAGDKDFMQAFKDNRHPQHKDRVAQRQAIIDKLAALERKQQSAA